MRYYIDLGMHNGTLLEKVISKFPPFDQYIGFEAVPQLCEEATERFASNDKVIIINKAVSTEAKSDVKFYMCYSKREPGEIGYGSTLLREKSRRNVDKHKFINVEMIDFSKYIIDNFDKSDEIVLKIDIEGEEYNLLKKMISSDAINYIDKIYCEWHYHKISGYKKNKKHFKKKHFKLVDRLNKFGFDLKGNNVDDELDYIIRGL